MPSALALVALTALQVGPGLPPHHEGSEDARPAGATHPQSAGPVARRGRTLVVGSDGEHATVSQAVTASLPGDTIRVRRGLYRERVEVKHPLTILGDPGAVLDGGDRGTVLHLSTCPGSTVRGLTIRGSGRNVSREDSGVMAQGCPGLVIEENRIMDVLFGVYLKESREAVVRTNEVVGKALPVNRRGDGIRFWYSSGGRIVENSVRRTRDVVIWFSDSLEVRDNVVEEGRYGLHYMYSDHNGFHGNRFAGNRVGAFLMYSSDIRLDGNVFAASRGASGMGLGLKDADDVEARRNTFVANAVGVYLDNSPRSAQSSNRFRNNLLALNDVGVSLLPSVRANDFLDNDFVQNGRQVVVSGGGDALKNRWRGNHWSEYAGFDGDEDGIGDTPFVLSRLSDRLVSGYPALELFHMSPAAAALDVLARVLPFLEPRPVVVDSLPRLAEPPGMRVVDAATATPGRLLAASVLALGALGAGLGVARARGVGGRGRR